MNHIVLSDISTHPTVGSWVWGKAEIAYQVVRRYRDREEGRFWLRLDTASGLVDMPLERVKGWSQSPPVGKTEAARFKHMDRVRIVCGSDQGVPGVVGKRYPEDGVYLVLTPNGLRFVESKDLELLPKGVQSE